MRIRPYNPETDNQAVHRIWVEIGWLEKGNKKQRQAMDTFIEGCQALVAEVRKEAECLVLTTPATLRYQKATLKFSAVTGVMTSLITRKKGLAGHVTARAIADAAMDGADVTGLGIFDQGYYNKLGFGTMTYLNAFTFDPAALLVQRSSRIPHRLSEENWKHVHRNRLTRLQGHGSCSLTPPEVTKSEMMWSDNGFGLGYYDETSGELTHHMWISSKDREHGPYNVWWWAYRNASELTELLGLLKTLSNQVYTVRLIEPPQIQFQDLLKEPFRHRRTTAKSKHENQARSSAYYQVRILNLTRCLERTHLACEPVRFNVELSDPIERYLSEERDWRGIGGEYVIELGPDSHAELGREHSLPTLTASVGAFTRLWLGVRPASNLTITDKLKGPASLIERLDQALRLPAPKLDWGF
jgi:predicted acetyltransferase